MTQIEDTMETFNVRDLRDHLGEVTKAAEDGKLSMITKHGVPLFLTVPFSERLLEHGLNVNLAFFLFSEGLMSLGKAASFSGLSKEAFIEALGASGFAAVDYSAKELDAELESLR
jgi:prevent-host-death family protein